MDTDIKGRVFLVGCARSGTTLLQAMIAAHPSIISFPETQYFSVLIGQSAERMYGISDMGESLFRKTLKEYRLGFGLAFPRGEKARNRVRNLLKSIGQPERISAYPANAISIDSHVAGFKKVLDTITLQQGRSIWLEKSPNHLYYIQEIRRYINDAKFIHIVRKGQDVVASIYDAAIKFGGGNDFKADVDDCIQRWNSAVGVSRALAHEPDHLIVQYERLVDNPPVELSRIVGFLGIPYEDSMLMDYSSAAKSLIRSGERWKESVGSSVENRGGQKFMELFDSDTREYIQANLDLLD